MIEINEQNFPGKVGDFVWFCHHEIILEILTEPMCERARYIAEYKPGNEVETRLRYFQAVKYTERLPQKVIKALVEHHKALAEYRKARTEHHKARTECDKARTECASEIEALMREELGPDVPWNGKSLVFPKEPQT